MNNFLREAKNRCRIYCYSLAFLSTAQDFWLLLVTKVTENYEPKRTPTR